MPIFDWIVYCSWRWMQGVWRQTSHRHATSWEPSWRSWGSWQIRWSHRMRMTQSPVTGNSLAPWLTDSSSGSSPSPPSSHLWLFYWPPRTCSVRLYRWDLEVCPYNICIVSRPVAPQSPYRHLPCRAVCCVTDVLHWERSTAALLLVLSLQTNPFVHCHII